MSKVVLGCKVPALTKSTFIGHANKLGLGVSEYLQLLIEQELERISLALPEQKKETIEIRPIRLNTESIEEAEIEPLNDMSREEEIDMIITMMKMEVED